MGENERGPLTSDPWPTPHESDAPPSGVWPPTAVGALAQAFLVSGLPTQALILVVLTQLAGMSPINSEGSVTFRYFFILSVLDTALVAFLVWFFLTRSHESPAEVLFGNRPIRREILLGLALIPFAFGLVLATVWTLRLLAPWTHNVEVNPLEQLMATPVQGVLFAVVAILAGGVREEMQRAFVLHRFEQRLGGIGVGLVVFSLLFAALHWNQGIDAAVGIGLLGLFWGLLYVRRRSAICAMVNHGGFNAVQVLQAMVARSIGA